MSILHAVLFLLTGASLLIGVKALLEPSQTLVEGRDYNAGFYYFLAFVFGFVFLMGTLWFGFEAFFRNGNGWSAMAFVGCLFSTVAYFRSAFIGDVSGEVRSFGKLQRVIYIAMDILVLLGLFLS